MLKFIYKIGITYFFYCIWKLNSKLIKRIFFSIALIIFTIFFYSDLRDILREINPTYLIHALILKWTLIVGFIYWLTNNLLKLKVSEKSLMKEMSTESKEKTELGEDSKNITKNLSALKSLQENSDLFSDLRDIKKNPVLETEEESILKPKR